LKGAQMSADRFSWSFTTEGSPAVHAASFALDLQQTPVHWHGTFFSGSD
jgi:hypothetical protein